MPFQYRHMLIKQMVPQNKKCKRVKPPGHKSITHLNALQLIHQRYVIRVQYPPPKKKPKKTKKTKKNTTAMVTQKHRRIKHVIGTHAL